VDWLTPNAFAAWRALEMMQPDKNEAATEAAYLRVSAAVASRMSAWDSVSVRSAMSLISINSDRARNIWSRDSEMHAIALSHNRTNTGHAGLSIAWFGVTAWDPRMISRGRNNDRNLFTMPHEV
jgi:hypothetical protein